MSVFRRGQKGFTLTEIMVVTAIITLILGIALPNFARMKANASQSAAIKALRTLNTAFEEFWQDQTPHRYPRNLAELESIPAIQGSPPYAPSNLTDGKYQGYYFSVVTPDAYTYSIQATPTNPAVSGNVIYAVASSGTISNDILACPEGNTGEGFEHLGGGAPGRIMLPPGHPRTPVDIPAQYLD